MKLVVYNRRATFPDPARLFVTLAHIAHSLRFRESVNIASSSFASHFINPLFVHVTRYPRIYVRTVRIRYRRYAYCDSVNDIYNRCTKSHGDSVNMPIVSDAMYDAQEVVSSNVSSSAYYGFIPQRTRADQQYGYNNWKGDDGHSMLVADHRIADDRHRSTTMDTDDGYNAASSRLSNYSVIPETTAWKNCRLEAIGDLQRGCDRQLQHQEQQQCTEVPWQVRRNRKRHNDKLELPVEPKKSREDDGNVYCGTRSNSYGVDEMHYEPSSLYLDTSDIQPVELMSITIDSCYWAAGNSSSISNPDYKHLLSSNGSKSNQGNSEYESMLFETHGCSIYHHQRTQLLHNDHIETEL